jgi:DedD protein
MAATVVSVVIFLCGVLVGRGVRAERASTGEAGTLGDSSSSELAIAAAPRVASEAAAPPATPPPSVNEDLSYFNRLDTPNGTAEELTPPPASAPAPATAPPAESAARPRESAPAPAPQPAARPASPGASQDFAVQIAALNVRSEADAMAKRLSSKGYSAFVLTPANGTPPVYRVRIGPFKTRREADTVAARLQKEEQFKPWVTR